MRSFAAYIHMLFLLAACTGENRVSVIPLPDQDRVEIYMDGALFTAYRYESELEKPVLFPVVAPGEVTITRGYPIDPGAKENTDHPHHTGCWLNFGSVNGFDFWGNSHQVSQERKKEMGRIIHREVIRAESKDKRGLLEVKMEWVAPDNEDASTLLEEQTIFYFRFDSLTRIIDRITKLTAIADEVVFNDNKEGFMAIRVHRAFDHPSDRPLVLTDAHGVPSDSAVLDNEGVTGWYRNSNGVEGIDVWGKRAKWVKLTGTRESEIYSIILFDHPENYGHPSCWHARGYGLFSVNNLGKRVFDQDLEPVRIVLEKGESITFKHRLAIFRGDATDRETEEIFSRFSLE
jgi:hypothetical protein